MGHRTCVSCGVQEQKRRVGSAYLLLSEAVLQHLASPLAYAGEHMPAADTADRFCASGLAPQVRSPVWPRVDQGRALPTANARLDPAERHRRIARMGSRSLL